MFTVFVVGGNDSKSKGVKEVEEKGVRQTRASCVLAWKNEVAGRGWAVECSRFSRRFSMRSTAEIKRSVESASGSRAGAVVGAAAKLREADNWAR